MNAKHIPRRKLSLVEEKELLELRQIGNQRFEQLKLMEVAGKRKQELKKECALLTPWQFKDLLGYQQTCISTETVARWLLAPPTPEYQKVIENINQKTPMEAATRLEMEETWKRLRGTPNNKKRLTRLVTGLAVVAIFSAEVIAMENLNPSISDKVALGMIGAYLFSPLKKQLTKLTTRYSINNLLEAKQPWLPQLDNHHIGINQRNDNQDIPPGMHALLPYERILLEHLDNVYLKQFLAGKNNTRQKILKNYPIPKGAWIKAISSGQTDFRHQIADNFKKKRMLSQEFIDNLGARERKRALLTI